MSQREDLITGTDGMADPGSETGSKAANAMTAGALAMEGMVTRRGAKERDREDADHRRAAAEGVKDARDTLDSREDDANGRDEPGTSEDDVAAKPKVVAELEADRSVTEHQERSGRTEQTPTNSQAHARPDVRASKVSVKEWLSAAHAPETESTKKVMTRAERELRHSEPELMRRFDQVQAQGLTRRDAMTSAMGSTRSASNQRGAQEASSHPSVVMDQHRPATTASTTRGATHASKTRKRTRKAKAAMSGSRR